jgi:hypothetical protein
VVLIAVSILNHVPVFDKNIFTSNHGLNQIEGDAHQRARLSWLYPSSSRRALDDGSTQRLAPAAPFLHGLAGGGHGHGVEPPALFGARASQLRKALGMSFG